MRATPNPLVNRARNGMPLLGLILFWPKRVTPPRAGYRELQGLPVKHFNDSESRRKFSVRQ